MLETSFLLLIKALLFTVLLPWIAGALILLITYPSLLKGWKFHILSWFLGVGIISNRLIDLQFVHFGVWLLEYLWLIVLLLVVLGIKMTKFGLNRDTIKQTLKCEKIIWLKESYQGLSKMEKILTVWWGIFVVWFLINSFVHTVNFPIYADDSFNNRTRPAVNIYYDGWIKYQGDESEILGRGTAGYPVHIAAFKAFIAKVMGGRHDPYMKLFQWLGLFLILILSFVSTFEKTKSIFYSIIPSVLIAGLPLIFWHAIDGYHELASVYYTILSLRLLYECLQTNKLGYMVVASWMLWILCYMKNDGFVVYMPAVVLGFAIVVLLQGRLGDIWKQVRNSKRDLSLIIWWIILLLIPFTAVKLSHGLGFDPTQSAAETGKASVTHREIFGQFNPMFIKENNYNIGLTFFAILLFLVIMYYNQKNHSKKQISEEVEYPNGLMTLITPVVMFILFTGVFLFTENYQWMMSQTTSNRVYTMCFVVLFYFFWMHLDELKRKK